MKRLNRMVTLLLVLALALALAAPAFAHDDRPDPAVPVITLQPAGVTVRDGGAFTLLADAEIPNGDPVAYQWYRSERWEDFAPVEGAVHPSFSGTRGIDDGPAQFYCLVFNVCDESKRAASEVAQVSVTKDFGPLEEFFGIDWELVLEWFMAIPVVKLLLRVATFILDLFKIDLFDFDWRFFK